jgi:hypothetical protein
MKEAIFLLEMWRETHLMIEMSHQVAKPTNMAPGITWPMNEPIAETFLPLPVSVLNNVFQHNLHHQL